MTGPNQTRHVVLTGLMGSGKTAVGRPLADLLGLPFVDNDALFEHETGLTARGYEDLHGRVPLHELEFGVLARALARETPSVVGAAASVADDDRTPELLGPHFVVWLTADVDTLVERTHGPDHRPLGEGARAAERLRRQVARRGPRLEAVADLVVDTVGHEPREIAAGIASRLRGS